jgi:hypothetical protein
VHCSLKIHFSYIKRSENFMCFFLKQYFKYLFERLHSISTCTSLGKSKLKFSCSHSTCFFLYNEVSEHEKKEIGWRVRYVLYRKMFINIYNFYLTRYVETKDIGNENFTRILLKHVFCHAQETIAKWNCCCCCCYWRYEVTELLILFFFVLMFNM